MFNLTFQLLNTFNDKSRLSVWCCWKHSEDFSVWVFKYKFYITLRYILFQIFISILIGVVCYQPITARHSCLYRSLDYLSAETKAILPGEVLNYQQGQLALIPQRYINITRVDEISCIPMSSYAPIAQRSSCPWKFVKNIDNNRDPKEIYEAVCRTRQCIGSMMSNCEKQSCEEIKHFTSVKRKAGENTFIKILEPISVGCTCACESMTTTFPIERMTMCT